MESDDENNEAISIKILLQQQANIDSQELQQISQTGKNQVENSSQTLLHDQRMELVEQDFQDLAINEPVQTLSQQRKGLQWSQTMSERSTMQEDLIIDNLQEQYHQNI
eukprot:403364592